MEQETPINKWVLESLEDWDKEWSGRLVSKSIAKEQRRSCRRSLDILGKIDANKLSGWRREWIKWSIETLREITSSESNEAELEEREPQWLEKIEKEYVQATMPTVSFRALKRPLFSDAAILGKLVGHVFANCHEDNTGWAALFERIKPEHRIILEAVVAYQRQKQMKRVRRIMADANQQSFKDACSFIKGFSMAIQKGSMTETGQPAGETSTTKIYGMLIMHQDFIPRLQSVNELYEWLQYMLGKSLIDDIKGFKRIEKICERIGLSFRPPGRPEIRQ